jgi:heme/copper-type cytochrome/quinol oxidase subunit 2
MTTIFAMTMSWRRGVMALAVAALWSAAGSTALACPVCFRIEEGPVASGVRAAVLVLIAVTVGVLTGFAVFIARFVRRAAAEGEP